MTSLALRPAAVRYHWGDGNVVNHVEVHYLDFMIDGEPLSDLVAKVGHDDMVTSLCRLWLDDVPGEVEHLMGLKPTPNLAPDRVALMVCKMDGDILCGAVTARLTPSEALVSWSDWLWETTLEESHVVSLPAVHFERAQYEALMLSALDQVEALPYDRTAHRGRRFLGHGNGVGA